MQLSEEFISKMRGSLERFFKSVLWHMFHRMKASKNGHVEDHDADLEHNDPSADNLFE